MKEARGCLIFFLRSSTNMPRATESQDRLQGKKIFQVPVASAATTVRGAQLPLLPPPPFSCPVEPKLEHHSARALGSAWRLG